MSRNVAAMIAVIAAAGFAGCAATAQGSAWRHSAVAAHSASTESHR